MPRSKARSYPNNSEEVIGVINIFGFESTESLAVLLPRTRAWRAGGAIRFFVLFSVIAGVLIFIPPHGVWTIGALVGGLILGRRRWSERVTLQSLQGTCPKCKTSLSVKSGPLRIPHPINCDGCHHMASLELPNFKLNRINGR